MEGIHPWIGFLRQLRSRDALLASRRIGTARYIVYDR